MDLVTLDGLGRILLPKALRDELHLKAGDRLLAVPADGKLLLKVLDIRDFARQLHDQVRGVDIEGLAQAAREHAEHEAQAYIEGVLAGHEPARGGKPKAARRDGKPAPARRRA